MENIIFCALKLLTFRFLKDYWTKNFMAEGVLRTSLKSKMELLIVLNNITNI